MKFIPPSCLTFWRSVFALTGLLPFLVVYQVLGSAEKLGVDLSVSRPWQGLIAGLVLLGLLSLLLLTLTFRPGSHRPGALSGGQAFTFDRERLLSLVEFPDTTHGSAWMGGGKEG